MPQNIACIYTCLRTFSGGLLSFPCDSRSLPQCCEESVISKIIPIILSLNLVVTEGGPEMESPKVWGGNITLGDLKFKRSLLWLQNI